MAPTPSDYAAITQAISQNQRILVVPHANVDPDGLSSALACYQVLSAMGKDVTVVCPDALPESLNFLPGFEHLSSDIQADKDCIISIDLQDDTEIDTLRYNVEDGKVNIIVIPKKGWVRPTDVQFKQGEQRYDLILVVDTADLELLGSLYRDNVDFFSSVPILNIDHHISNTQFGQLQLIDPTAASATEVLYSWWNATPEFAQHLTADVATLLLTGLITDTRSFQNPNTTPRSLEVSAELLDKGAAQQEIVQHIYKTKPLSTLQIWGRALSRIQIDPEAEIAWSSVSKEDLAEMSATSKETHGILDELISTIPEAQVHVLFTELEEGGLKASMRSSVLYNVSQIAAEAYGGGGHARAAGFKVQEFQNFQLQVVQCIEQLKAGMQRQRQSSVQGGGDVVLAEEIQPIEKESIAEPQEAPIPSAENAPALVPEAPASLPDQEVPPPVDVVSELSNAPVPEPKNQPQDVVATLSESAAAPAQNVANI